MAPIHNISCSSYTQNMPLRTDNYTYQTILKSLAHVHVQALGCGLPAHEEGPEDLGAPPGSPGQLLMLRLDAAAAEVEAVGEAEVGWVAHEASAGCCRSHGRTQNACFHNPQLQIEAFRTLLSHQTLNPFAPEAGRQWPLQVSR